ncbi:Uncharacterised protein [uncultured archaeon]|nr:Uncharacterised protein [uncultured archaeon]
MMGKVCLEIDLTGAPNSRSINESMDALRGLPVLVRMEGMEEACRQGPSGDELP